MGGRWVWQSTSTARSWWRTMWATSSGGQRRSGDAFVARVQPGDVPLREAESRVSPGLQIRGPPQSRQFRAPLRMGLAAQAAGGVDAVGDFAATHWLVSFALLSAVRRDHLAPNIR